MVCYFANYDDMIFDTGYDLDGEISFWGPITKNYDTDAYVEDYVEATSLVDTPIPVEPIPDVSLLTVETATSLKIIHIKIELQKQ
eukprot:7246616-Ditylum_brightwellii.AAC.1